MDYHVLETNNGKLILCVYEDCYDNSYIEMGYENNYDKLIKDIGNLYSHYEELANTYYWENNYMIKANEIKGFDLDVYEALDVLIPNEKYNKICWGSKSQMRIYPDKMGSVGKDCFSLLFSIINKKSVQPIKEIIVYF